MEELYNETPEKAFRDARKKIVKRIIFFLPAALLFAAVFFVIFTVIMLIIILTAAGLLSLPVSLGMLTGLLNNVATDLAPPAMALAGSGCLFFALALICVLFIVYPKAIKQFNRLAGWFVYYSNENSENDGDAN